MRWLGKVIGGAVGALGGPVGMLVGALGGDIAEDIGRSLAPGKKKSGVQDTYSPYPDYSAAMVYASDNNKTTALAQIEAGKFALQQASVDRQMQVAANLELGLERLDTNLQLGKLQFIEQMTAEQNRHQEKLADVNLQWRRLGRGGAEAYEDLPPPEQES